LVTDGRGLPLAVEVTPGQRHEAKQFEELMNAVRVSELCQRSQQQLPTALAGDKGYSSTRIREWLHHYGIRDVIPYKKDEGPRKLGGSGGFDRKTYRRRSIIECCISWLKECRRVATRFEKLARNFLATIKVAMIQQYLNKEFSDRP
jgi:transposase